MNTRNIDHRATFHIATSTLWQLGSQITMAALSILTVKFVAVGLSKELAGNYNSAYGFLQLFGILADFGLYAVAVREVARTKDTGQTVGQEYSCPTVLGQERSCPTISNKEKILGALIILRTIILICSLGLALLLVWIIPTWKGTPLPLSVTIAALVPFFTLLAGILRTIFQVNYKLHFVFIAEVSQRILTTALIGLMIYLGIRGTNDLHILHLFLFFGGCGAFLLFLISFVFGDRLMKIRFRWDSALLKKLAKEAAPFGIAFLCVALYRQFDVTMIALLRPDFELQNAYYGFVLRMADMGFLIPTFLLNSTLPILSERDAKGEDTSVLLGKTFLIILLLGTIAALFAALWARPLIQLLTTEQYLSTPARPGSDTALLLMSIPLFLNGIILYAYYVLLTKRKWGKLVKTLFAGAVLSIAINLILIPQYGFVGAAMTSIIVHIFLSLLLFPQAQKQMRMELGKSAILTWGVFSILLAGSLILIRPYLTHEIITLGGLVVTTLWMVVLIPMTRVHRIFISKISPDNS